MKETFDFFGTPINNEGGSFDSVTTKQNAVESSPDAIWHDINDDSRRQNGGLGPLPIKSNPVNEKSTPNLRSELSEIGHRNSGALAFGSPSNGGLLTSFDYEKKLLPLIEGTPNFSLKCIPLSKPAKYGATHRWMFEAELFPSLEPAHGMANILSIIPGKTLEDEFAISLTYPRIKPFLYRNEKNKIWLKLKAEERNGSIIISGV